MSIRLYSECMTSYAPRVRKIIHVDMDAFYAAVEQRDNPSLRGRPVVVGGSPESRGVVSTCSYEARVFGIRSAMSCAEARRRCPHAVFVSPPNFAEYRRVSSRIHGIFREFTDIVEPLSLEEADLDVTVNKLGEPSASRAAEEIRRRIARETGLTASAGVSFNKSLAKIASEQNKPDGLTVITPREAEAFLETLPASRFFGVGPVTARRMEHLGIHTGGDLRRRPLDELKAHFGRAGAWYYELCRGLDHREVITRRIRKSLGKERTFERDIRDPRVTADFMNATAADLWEQLEERGLAARRVTVKVKYADFRQVTRSRMFPAPVESLEELRGAALNLLGRTEVKSRPVRLLGLILSGFPGTEEENNRGAGRESGQLELNFDAPGGPPHCRRILHEHPRPPGERQFFQILH